ncbi:unnamed protein product [Ectocarpus sp. 6 AP-2014]
MHDLWQTRPRTRVSSSSMVACPLGCWGALACLLVGSVRKPRRLRRGETGGDGR